MVTRPYPWLMPDDPEKAKLNSALDQLVDTALQALVAVEECFQNPPDEAAKWQAANETLITAIKTLEAAFELRQKLKQ